MRRVSGTEIATLNSGLNRINARSGWIVSA